MADVVDTTASLTCTTPSNGGSAITGYDVQRRIEGGSDSFVVANRNVGPTTETITNLDPQTAYELQARAKNARGDGDWSPSGQGVPGLTTPEVFDVSFNTDVGIDDTYKLEDIIDATVTFLDAVLSHVAGIDDARHKVDAVRPALVGATVNGDLLTLAWSETLAGDPKPASSDFQVTVEGERRSATAVAVRGTDVTLTLASIVTLAETVTVSYTPGANAIHDLAQNAAAPFTDEPVTTVVNVVFILADDHATQAVSAYGSEIISTPNIDRLAAEGVTFDRALAPNSICSPARATLLTGKYSHRNGQQINWSIFDGGQQQVQKLLGRAGYTTAMIGKWHLKSDPQGFHHWEVLAPSQGTYYDPRFDTVTGPVTRTGYATNVITDRAIEWIEGHRSAKQPFMAFVWHKAPHGPWDPAPDDITRFAEVRYPIPETFRDTYAGRASPLAQQTVRIDRNMTDRQLKLAASYPDVPGSVSSSWQNRRVPDADSKAIAEWKFQTHLHDYLRVVHGLDESVGKLLDYLDSAGLRDNTLVIYASDQGFFLGQHGWYGKRWFHEESVRLPLIVRPPGVEQAGSRISQIVSQTDIAPTLVNIAGIDVPADMQGKSLLPFLQGIEPTDWRTSFYYHYSDCPGTGRVAPHRAVMTDRYKLVSYYQTGEWELFDRENDPTEVNNVYPHADYADVVPVSKAELQRLRTELGDDQEGPATAVNEAPEFEEGETATRTLPENVLNADIGERLRATDTGDDALKYAVAGTDSPAFSIVVCDGQLRTRSEVAYDYEEKTSYSVQVHVEDAHGATDTITVTISVEDVDEPPDQPLAPVISGQTQSSLTVDWAEPHNLGPPITDYDYRYRTEASGEDFTEVVDTAIAATGTTITGLDEETSYEVQVRAANDEGLGAWSDSLVGSTAAN